MMITPEYCLTMARYNAWQNRQVKAFFANLDPVALKQDRKAFFGSLLGTANHLLWGDLMWMSRFTGAPPPAGGIKDTPTLTATREEWEIARFRADADILIWSERLRAVDLTGDLTWYSGAVGREVSKPKALCVAHMFNHQTHHRGQIHAMLTAAGVEAPVSDLAFMSAEGPWL
ncbi:DinB family protein [Antarctobacter heliothermus]|uniref:DinB family protein n=1 Tax=Antarctobacter heliothermus TaxID=74033 RepID=A0A222E582_9RHOB|nr:DinB family protein [Antarctobacter heliothermus]ASP21374.1 DinB family protein [Antarctobacter heliothermus]